MRPFVATLCLVACASPAQTSVCLSALTCSNAFDGETLDELAWQHGFWDQCPEDGSDIALCLETCDEVVAVLAVEAAYAGDAEGADAQRAACGDARWLTDREGAVLEGSYTRASACADVRAIDAPGSYASLVVRGTDGPDVWLDVFVQRGRTSLRDVFGIVCRLLPGGRRCLGTPDDSPSFVGIDLFPTGEGTMAFTLTPAFPDDCLGPLQGEVTVPELTP